MPPCGVGLREDHAVVTFVGLDLGTGGVRATALDAEMRVVTRVAIPLAAGRRSGPGEHRLDEARIHDAVAHALDTVVRHAGSAPTAIAVSGTAGTICFRDRAGRVAADAVAYDDARFGRGLDRVMAWASRIPDAARVIPVADAVLEALGAEAGSTDWNNASKLGWSPEELGWPAESSDLVAAGFLPDAVPPGTIAGRATEPAGVRGALLVRGTTDGCAMQVAGAPLHEGDWTVSLGTTLVWKAVAETEGRRGSMTLPEGAYVHPLRPDLWLPGAASNCGGGVALALEPGRDLAERDAAIAGPSGYAAYPLARPGERFPVCNTLFTGFGLPAAGHPRLHAAILEGVAMVMRLGIERLVAAGVPEPRRLTVTGGGARSGAWMRIVASVLDREVVAAPDLDPALGSALLAAAAVQRAPVASIAAGPGAGGQLRTWLPDPLLRDGLSSGYRQFVELVGQFTGATSTPLEQRRPTTPTRPTRR